MDSGAVIRGGVDARCLPSRTALVIVDPQNDFCHPEGAMAKDEGLDVGRVLATVGSLNRLIETARAAKVPVVWVRESFDARRMRPNQQARWCDESGRVNVVGAGTWGAEFYSGVTAPLEGEPVITKWHYDAFEATELDLLLRAMGRDCLVVAGYITNVCVETTVRRAYILGYYVTVPKDCTQCYLQTAHEASLASIAAFFGDVVSSDEIVKLWGSMK